jgi:hypothetical protein
MKLATPDFTPEAILALAIAALVSLVILFEGSGPWRTAAFAGLWAVVLAAYLIHSAIVRRGRANIVANRGETEADGYIAPD